MSRPRHLIVAGFTLIELMVSMLLLVVLVLISSRLFNTASQTWNVGTRKAEVNLIARTVLDYLDGEISRAVFSTNSNSRLHNRRPTGGDNTIQFYTLSDSTNGPNKVGVVERVIIRLIGQAPNTQLVRNTNEIVRYIDSIQFDVDDIDPDWPAFVDITLKLRASEDRATTGDEFLYVYSNRVYFSNFNRYRHDDY